MGFFLCRATDNGRDTYVIDFGGYLWAIPGVYLKEGRKNEEQWWTSATGKIHAST
jgi:hypothetical protein